MYCNTFDGCFGNFNVVPLDWSVEGTFCFNCVVGSNAALSSWLLLFLTCWIILFGNWSTTIDSKYSLLALSNDDGIGKPAGSIGSKYSIANRRPRKPGIWL